MRTEPFDAHPGELQVWAVRSRPPVGQGLRAWAGYLLGLVIRAFTAPHGGRYSHLLVRLGDAIWEAAAQGIREGRAVEYSDRRYVVDVFAVPVAGESLERVVGWMRASEGVAYDWPQLLRIALAELGYDPDGCFVPDFGDAWLVCSEFVALACRAGGVDVLGETPLWRWTPDHILAAARAGRVTRRGRLTWPADARGGAGRCPVGGGVISAATSSPNYAFSLPAREVCCRGRPVCLP
ncbi:MAG: hypothetical protein ACOC8D_01805 [bacterium]